MLALLVVSQPQKLRIRNSRHFNGILKRHEHALARTLVRRHLKQVLALVKHLAFGYLISRMASQNLGERRLAGAVWSHDGVNLALLHGQVNPLQDLVTVNACMQILDL